MALKRNENPNVTKLLGRQADWMALICLVIAVLEKAKGYQTSPPSIGMTMGTANNRFVIIESAAPKILNYQIHP